MGNPTWRVSPSKVSGCLLPGNFEILPENSYLCAVIRQVDRFALIATTEKNAKTVSSRCPANNPSLPLLNIKN